MHYLQTRKIPKDIWALKSIIDHASELKKNATTNSLVFAQARQILRWSARLLLRAPELVKTREGREYLRPRIACLIMKLSRAADRILEETYEERREIENKQTKVNQAIRILREGLSLTTVRTALYKHKETAV